MSNVHIQQTVKVEKFVLPQEARPPVTPPPMELDDPMELDEKRAGRIVSAALWITAAAIVAALWLLTY